MLSLWPGEEEGELGVTVLLVWPVEEEGKLSVAMLSVRQVSCDTSPS